ncbi:MAG: maleylpyruvate isomerase family mycothiol-dependent enzyme, partial [Actinomycetota bacterium]
MRLFELLDDVWRSTVALCEDLAPEEWEVETDCPGWTVKDVVSHLAGTESWLLGRAPPDHDPGSRDYVRNDLGRANEVFVDFRRSWPPRRVLDEFKEVTSERLAVLGAWGEDDLEAGSWTPFGPGTARQLLEARVADGWIHEQDVRRAVGRPGHQDGPVAGFVLRGLVRNGLGYAVAKKAGCPDGTTVQFEVTGPKPLDATVFVAGGRGRASEG